MPKNPAMPQTYKGKQQLLKEFPINGSFYIGIYQGTISVYDIILRYRQKENGEWSRPRTPKHIHWAVDILIKQYLDNKTTTQLLDFFIDLWDNKISPWRTNAERMAFIDPQKLLNEVNNEATNYTPLAQKGEYSVKFLILLAKLLMAQEKTNNDQAYMFRKLLEALKNHNNIFKIVSTATYR